MEALEMVKLSEANLLNGESWLSDCINRMKTRAESGHRNITIVYGKGTLYDAEFRDDLYRQQNILLGMGYYVTITKEAVKNTLGTEFFYSFYIKW